MKGDYYHATTFETSSTDFSLIRFNHRLAYVKASDVDVVAP